MPWVEWSPDAHPHVKGRYTQREFEDGEPQPQRVEAHCTLCKTDWQGECKTGAVRSHIARFAAVHAHRDPFSVNKRRS